MRTNDNITIRKADSGDLFSLVNICRLAYSENFAHHWNEGGLPWYLDNVYSKEAISHELTQTDLHYFIAISDDEPVGFMKLHLQSNLPHLPPDEGMEIEKLYFLKNYQGKGIGKQFMQTVFEMAREKKKRMIWLGVIDTNESAIAFYKKMGFAFYDKTRLNLPYFKEELKGMWRMALNTEMIR
jgi:ribosomal protein S18 acetylase RimI-like enzyme